MKELSIINEPKTLTEIVRVAPTLPTIGKLIREGNNPLLTIQKSITLILTMYGYNSTDEELTILSSTFLDNATKLTIEDIKLFTKKCLAGDYNDKYKPKFQLHFLMEWLKEYKDERMETAEIINSGGKQSENIPLTEKAKEIITEILEMTKPIYSTDTIPESEDFKLAKKKQSEIELEFMKIWEEQGCNETEGINPIKFITVNGKFMVKSEYVKLKFNGK